MVMAAACSHEETFTDGVVLSDLPSDSPAEGVYTYNLHFDLPGMTRAAGIWADGSQVEFFFYTEATQTGYKGISGTATYNATEQAWTLTTNAKLPTNPASTDCEARYYKPGADPSNEFLTAVYYATGSYVCQGDTDVYADVTLKPCNWRLRFKGTAGTQLTLTATNIRHCTGDSLHATADKKGERAYVPLTVGSDGYTSYIYGTFADASTAAELTVTTGGEEFTRSISPTELITGNGVVLDIPTMDNYDATVWTYVAPPEITLTLSPDSLFFDAAGGSQEVKVTSSDMITYYSDQEWCTLESGVVTVEQNQTFSARKAYVTFITVTYNNGEDIYTIGADGYWYKNGEVTDVKAFGEGAQIPQGVRAKNATLVVTQEANGIEREDYGDDEKKI